MLRKNLILVMFSLATLATICTSCSPVRYLLINSNGIMSYNRHTGQFEVLWEHHSVSADNNQPASIDSIHNEKKLSKDTVVAVQK